MRITARPTGPGFAQLRALKGGAKVRKTIAVALTDVAFAVRKQATSRWWKQDVTARNRAFARAAIIVEKGRSRTLRAAVFDRLKRASMSHQLEQHTRSAFGGHHRAVPTRYAAAKRGGGGKMPKAWAPTGKGVFKQDGSLFKRVGRGKAAKVIKLYTLKASVSQPKRFKFIKRADRLAARLFPRRLAQRLEFALRR